MTRLNHNQLNKIKSTWWIIVYHAFGRKIYDDLSTLHEIKLMVRGYQSNFLRFVFPVFQNCGNIDILSNITFIIDSCRRTIAAKAPIIKTCFKRFEFLLCEIKINNNGDFNGRNNHTRVGGYISPVRSFPVSNKFRSCKSTCYILNHIRIWQVSPQLSCSDTSEILMWYLINNISLAMLKMSWSLEYLLPVK